MIRTLLIAAAAVAACVLALAPPAAAQSALPGCGTGRCISESPIVITVDDGDDEDDEDDEDGLGPQISTCWGFGTPSPHVGIGGCF
jgi:hypothetical protein